MALINLNSKVIEKFMCSIILGKRAAKRIIAEAKEFKKINK